MGLGLDYTPVHKPVHLPVPVQVDCESELVVYYTHESDIGGSGRSAGSQRRKIHSDLHIRAQNTRCSQSYQYSLLSSPCATHRPPSGSVLSRCS